MKKLLLTAGFCVSLNTLAGSTIGSPMTAESDLVIAKTGVTSHSLQVASTPFSPGMLSAGTILANGTITATTSQVQIQSVSPNISTVSPLFARAQGSNSGGNLTYTFQSPGGTPISNDWITLQGSAGNFTYSIEADVDQSIIPDVYYVYIAAVGYEP